MTFNTKTVLNGMKNVSRPAYYTKDEIKMNSSNFYIYPMAHLVSLYYGKMGSTNRNQTEWKMPSWLKQREEEPPSLC